MHERRRKPKLREPPVIWTAAPGEAASVARLLREFGDWWGSAGPSAERMVESVSRIMEGGDGEYLLGATEPGSDPDGVAQVRFRWSVWKGADDCYLEDLFVREPARRSGLGRALVEAAVERAQARGCRRIELDVNENNQAARDLYAACGFSFEPKPPGRTLFIARALG
jgi:ribosomal protein S18 acetylase RimI-like enzyme